VSIGLTYDESTVDAVEIAVTGLPVLTAGTATAIVQRSWDGGIRWTTVRGLAEATISGAGAMVAYPSRDYEFRPGYEHTYRAGLVQEIVDTFTRTVASGGWGTADSGAVWTGTASQQSVASGRGVIIHDSAGQTIAPRLAGYPTLDDFTLTATIAADQVSTVAAILQGFRFRAVDSSNHYRADVSWGLSGAATLTLRRVDAGVTTNLEAAALADTYSALEDFRIKIQAEGTTLRAKAWQAADVEPSAWTVETTDDTYAAGEIQAYSRRETGNTNANATTRLDDLTVDTGTPTWLGGSFTSTITPTTDRIWIKSVTRPFQNLQPFVCGYTDRDRSARSALTEVSGRTNAIVHEELMNGGSVTLDLYVNTLANRDLLDWLAASGDVLFVQVPLDCPVPWGYFRLDSTAWRRFRAHGLGRVVTYPLNGCAAPGPDVAAAQATSDTIVALYGDWETLVAAGMDYEQFLELLGTPSEVIVE